jgi:hypothetical protein
MRDDVIFVERLAFAMSNVPAPSVDRRRELAT